MSDQYDGPELVRQVRMLREENERLRLHIDKRAAGVDPLTQQLRERAERAEAERDALRKDAEQAAGKTAMRCIEMAMWPQGIDDEQAYYGRMFAEFIEKEFKGAIDAAMRGEEQGNANPDR